jgi:hypothetical protein
MFILNLFIFLAVAAAKVQAIYYGDAGNTTISTQFARVQTPGCSYDLANPGVSNGKAPFPPLFLYECTQPLADTAVDFRGLWRDTENPDNSMERIEQCGLRIIVTAGGVVHDTFIADGTLENGVKDVSYLDCSPINVAGSFNTTEATFTFYDANNTEIVSRRRVNATNMEWIHPLNGIVMYQLVEDGPVSAASTPTSAALSAGTLVTLIFMLCFIAN